MIKNGMNEPWCRKQIHPKLEKSLKFRISEIKEIEELFTGEVNGREKMRKALNNYVAISRKISS